MKQHIHVMIKTSKNIESDPGLSGFNGLEDGRGHVRRGVTAAHIRRADLPLAQHLLQTVLNRAAKVVQAKCKERERVRDTGKTKYI